MSTPYQQLIANQQAQKQTVLENQQQRQEQAKKNQLVNTISQGLVADQMLTSGEGRKQLGSFIADQLGIGSTPISSIPTNTPVASSINGGTVLADGSVAPMSPTGLQATPTSFDWGSGIAGGLQTINAIDQYKKGNKLGAGIYGVAGVSNIGSALGNETLGGIAPIAGGLAGLYQGYQTAKMIGDAPTGRGRTIGGAVGGAGAGASIGTAILPGVGTAIGAGAGALLGAIGAEFGSSKDKDQMGRDAVRKKFGELKFVDDQFNVSLADGTKFNIGVDGKARPEYGIDPNTGKAMHAFDLNHSDPLVKQLVPMVNPLVNVLTGGNAKLASDFTGYLVRAAMSNSGGDFKKAMANVQGFYQQLNADPKALSASIDSMLGEKKIDAQTAAIWKNDINKATAGMNWGSQGAGSQIIIGGGGFKSTPIPKPAPQPYQPTKSVSQSYAARSQQTQAPQGQNVGALYSNFAKNFVPQSSVNRREQ